jgi:Holliday junction resolvase-like predicted endonuclease
MVVFVEVKTRNEIVENKYGTALEAVDKHKREHIIKTAKRWIYENPRYSECNFRFDVAEIQVIDGEKPKIKYLKSAFLL